MTAAKKRVLVIGAGPSGTAVLRAFSSEAAKGVAIPEIVCYEKQADLGGLWNYSWRTGLDGNGEPVHNSMYRYLWSNGPKEVLEFADYGFEEHFGRAIPSYPPREVLLNYIKGRVEKSGVREWIEFNSAVRRVVHDPAGNGGEGTFHVTTSVSTNGNDNTAEKTEVFDFVVVATGHFSTPNAPEFPGFDNFDGRVLHAHDFRDALEFKGKDTLVIGASYSAEDIASQCYKYGVKSVTLSWRRKPMEYDWPDNFSTVPLLAHVRGDTAYFQDGSSKRVDAIILCTGYKHHFPFMEESIKLKTESGLWIEELHKGIFLPHNPKVMYLGMQDQWFTFNMFDAQAWYARDFVLGKIALPSQEDMDAEWSRWRARERTLRDPEENIRFQADYVGDLIEQTDYPMFDLEGVVRCFIEWLRNKDENICSYSFLHILHVCLHLSLPQPVSDFAFTTF